MMTIRQEALMIVVALTVSTVIALSMAKAEIASWPDDGVPAALIAGEAK